MTFKFTFIESIPIILGLLIYFLITIALSYNMILNLLFVKPMRKKYNIMAPDISRNISLGVILIELIVIIIYFYFCYNLFNNLLFILSLIVNILLIFNYILKIKKYTILDYMKLYSTDLFDWDKIYSLNIEEHIKKEIFKLHYIDYNSYKDTYIKNLELKEDLIKLEKERIKGEQP